jgi:hypothetical protein
VNLFREPAGADNSTVMPTQTYLPGPAPNTVRTLSGQTLPVPAGWVLLPPFGSRGTPSLTSQFPTQIRRINSSYAGRYYPGPCPRVFNTPCVLSASPPAALVIYAHEARICLNGKVSTTWVQASDA